MKKRVLITTAPFETIPLERRIGRRKVSLKTVDECMAAGNNPEYLSGIVMPNFGLHFLKANVPSLQIAEYPTWDEFEELVKFGDYDAVGISFYSNSMAVVVKMISICRKYGVDEVWGGNYGAMTPGADRHFDKVFIGNAEAQIKRLVENEELGSIKHPVLISDSAPSPLAKSKMGYLYTIRGCGLKCSFCMTPQFAPDLTYIPLDEIRRVLDIYSERGVEYIMIQDETFFQNKAHCRQVMRELSKRGFLWLATTRADHIIGRINEFCDHGMINVYMGIESVNPDNLKKTDKKQEVEKVFEVINRLKDSGCLVAGTYILCFEDDTPESICRDISILDSLGLYTCVFMILTPYFGTSIYSEMKKKNMIIEDCPEKYDDFNLVWRHPKINPSQARELLSFAIRNTCDSTNYYKRKVLNKWKQLEKNNGTVK